MYMAMWGEIGCLPDGYSGCYATLKETIEDVAFTFDELSTVNLRDLQRYRIIYREDTCNRQREYNLVGASLIEIVQQECDACDNWIAGQCALDGEMY